MVESNKPLVVITGVTGFIGSYTLELFLNEMGETHNIRVTVRDKTNDKKMEPLRAHFGSRLDQVEFVNADLLDDASLDKAIEGATYVIHTASPVELR